MMAVVVQPPASSLTRLQAAGDCQGLQFTSSVTKFDSSVMTEKVSSLDSTYTEQKGGADSAMI